MRYGLIALFLVGCASQQTGLEMLQALYAEHVKEGRECQSKRVWELVGEFRDAHNAGVDAGNPDSPEARKAARAVIRQYDRDCR